jgi:hypothetical protein
MRCRLIQAGAILALSTAPVIAQMSVPLNPKRPPTQEELDKQKAADQAYEATMHKIPDKKPPADPWGNIRPSSPTASKNKQQ